MRPVLALLLLAFVPGCDGCAGRLTGGEDGGGPAGDGAVRDLALLVCADAAGVARCGDRCVELATDGEHCGACGRACAATARCCAGTCVEAAACSFAVTRATPDRGWQNGGGYVRLEGAGFAAGMRVRVGDGRAPVRVLSPTEAIIQLPPGRLGRHDLQIVLNNSTASLRDGFTYESGGLGTPWQQKPLATVRGEDPGVAVMQDGRVLIAGGTLVPDAYDKSLDTAEIFTRSTDRVTAAANTMATPRWQNSAVTLLDGRVLVVGGACYSDLSRCVGDPARADLFDPATDTFRPTATPLNKPRAYTRAVLLVDGRVLLASSNDPSLEIYDPAADRFTLIAHDQVHIFGFLVRLRDGRVLLGGGDGGNTKAELFDPDTDTLAPTGNLQIARSMLSAHTLPDGRVLVIGGSDVSAGGIRDPQTRLEAYDPVAGTFSILPYALATPRTWHASALVRDGTVLVMGGYTVTGRCDSLVKTVEQIDPVAAAVMPFADLLNPNTEWNAVTLLDGSVLGVGGGACGTSSALPDLDFLASNPG